MAGNIDPPPSMPANGDRPNNEPPNGSPLPNGDAPNGDAPNGDAPNGEDPNDVRKNGSSKGERKNGVLAKRGSLSNAEWRSPKSELKSSKGSVKANGRRERPNPELKKGSFAKGSCPNALNASLLELRSNAGCSAGGGQTPCLSYSCTGPMLAGDCEQRESAYAPSCSLYYSAPRMHC